MDAQRRRTCAVIVLLGVVILGAGALAWRNAHAVAARPAAAVAGTTLTTGEPFAREVRTYISTPEHQSGFAFIGDPRDHRYHRPDCALVKALPDSQPLSSRGQAEALGYKPCDICKP